MSPVNPEIFKIGREIPQTELTVNEAIAKAERLVADAANPADVRVSSYASERDVLLDISKLPASTTFATHVNGLYSLANGYLDRASGPMPDGRPFERGGSPVGRTVGFNQKAILDEIDTADREITTALDNIKTIVDTAATAAAAGGAGTALNPADLKIVTNSEKRLIDLRTKLRESKRKVEDFVTYFENDLHKDVVELKKKFDDRDRASGKIGDILEEKLKEELADLEKMHNGNRWTKAIRAWNRASGSRALVGAGLSAMLAAFPGGALAVVAAKGLLSAGNMASVGDAYGSKRIENSSRDRIAALTGLDLGTAPPDDIADALKARFQDLTSDAEKKDLVDSVMKAYSGLTHISSIKGLQIDASLLESRRKAGTPPDGTKGWWPEKLDKWSQVYSSWSRIAKLGIGAMLGGAAVLAGPWGLAAVGAVQAGLSFFAGRTHRETGEIYEYSNGVEGIQQFIKKLAADDVGKRILGMADGNEENAASTLTSSVRAYRERAKNVRKGYMIGGAVLGVGSVFGSAAMRGLITPSADEIRGAGAVPSSGGGAGVEGVVTPETSPTYPGTEGLTPAAGAEAAPTPETEPGITLNLRDATDQINEWRSARGMETDPNAVLYNEGPGADRRLAETVVNGYLNGEGKNLHLTDQQRSDLVENLANKWRYDADENLFNPEDGSLNLDKRDILKFGGRGGIDSKADVLDVMKDMQQGGDLPNDLPLPESSSAFSVSAETDTSGMSSASSNSSTTHWPEQLGNSVERGAEWVDKTWNDVRERIQRAWDAFFQDRESSVSLTSSGETPLAPELNQELNARMMDRLNQMASDAGSQEDLLARLETMTNDLDTYQPGPAPLLLTEAAQRRLELENAFPDLAENLPYYRQRFAIAYAELSRQFESSGRLAA